MNRAIEWFARNHVAANLLMFGILVAGLLTFPTIKQTVFPDFEIHYVTATVVYPGASPEDIEKSVTLRIEEELQDVQAALEVPEHRLRHEERALQGPGPHDPAHVREDVEEVEGQRQVPLLPDQLLHARQVRREVEDDADGGGGAAAIGPWVSVSPGGAMVA